MGKAKGKKGKRGQESDDDDDYVDPIKAAMAAAGGDGDDEPAGMATKKGNKKKGKGKKGAESDDDEPPAPEPAKQLTKAQERKAKKKGKNRGDSTDEDEPAPAPADDGAPKKPSRAELRKQKKAKKGGKAAESDGEDEDPLAKAAAEPEAEADDDDEEEDAPAPLPAASSRKKDKKAQRKAAAMAAMAADESDEEEEEPAEEVAAPARRRRKKDKKAQRKAAAMAAMAADDDAFAAAMAAAEDDDDGAGGDAGELRERLDKYEKKLAKAVKKGEDTTKYAEKIKKYEARLAELAAAERARAAEREADVDAEKAALMAGGLLSKDDGVWRDDSNDKLGPNAGPVVEATFDICLERAVAANGGKPLSSKAKRKLEKDYASRKREAEELKAKELATRACSSPTASHGIVGPNGRGKTTLLKMIASGDLKTPPRVQCLYVEQEVQADDTCAVDAVVRADAERSALLAEEKALAAKLEAGGLAAEDQQATSERLSAVGSELLAIGAHAAESKARRILFGLGFSAEMQQRATKLFSGGWRMRISLARALFMEPVLLMLDEPTNHLDLNAVIWLDDYLQKYKHTILVVSHDQDFLNSVCDEMLHISEERTLDHYRGNYDTFKTLEQQKRAAQLKAWEKQEKQLRALKASRTQGQGRGS
ncbi:translation activator [Aureococcus anophagefferens]|nr:translation activator [Aureococcus anophagefferens]